MDDYYIILVKQLSIAFDRPKRVTSFKQKTHDRNFCSKNLASMRHSLRIHQNHFLPFRQYTTNMHFIERNF